MTCQPRYATPRTPSRKTLGGIAAKIAKQLGREPMQWQQDWWDLVLELNDDDTFAYRDATLLLPRQNGKTFAIEVFLLTRALYNRNQRLKYTAQTLSDARKMMVNTWLPELDRSPLSPYYTARLANGSEAIKFTNGSELSLVASTLKSGHGTTNDVAVIDEGFSLKDDRMEQALVPSQATRPSPQFVVVSTAGTPHGSPFLLGRVESGRQLAQAGVNTTSCYVEYSADEDADPSDPATWASANPALGSTIPESAIAVELGSMDLSEFRRARLNQWTTAAVQPVVPLVQWNALADLRAAPPEKISLAFDVTPDRAIASIAIAGKLADGRFYVELTDNARGTEWVPARVAELVTKYSPSGVFCDPAGPAGSLLPTIAGLGVAVTQIQAAEHARACGRWYDLVTEGNLVHRGQRELLSALDGAVKRQLGDAWLWSRRSSSVDISPLVSVTLALWGSQQAISPPQIISLDEVVARMRAEGRLESEPKPPPGQHPNFVSIWDAPRQ
jgi:hypothetical protein